MIAGVDQSLKRMKIDYMDVVQFHISPSMETLRKDGAMEALQELQEQGKVRHIGMSGTLPNLPEHIESGTFAVLQIPYSALERQHEDLISLAAAKGIGNVIRGGVAKGEPGESGVTGRVSWDPFEQAKLDELLDVGESRTSFMLRFTVSHPGMHTTIVGTLNPDHLQQNVRRGRNRPSFRRCVRRSKEENDRRWSGASHIVARGESHPVTVLGGCG